MHVFKTHGSRDIYDIILRSRITDDYVTNVANTKLENFYGGLFMFDQEPVDFDQLFFDYDKKPNGHHDYHKDFNKQQLMYLRMSKVYTPIICHSEKNSSEIEYFKSRGFLDAHFWYHGLIAREWYRHWKHYIPETNNAQRLGCYIRDTGGTRKYRVNVLDLLERESIFCPLLKGETYTSEASAMLEWSDTARFDIQVVAETLFDTPKTHLTEKVLKPIAMEQPFILFAGPNSLEYMRNYGFQTFACCWDESYDKIQDSKKRYQAVEYLIKHLNSLPKDQYNRIINRAKLIAKNNREHFYSQQFEDTLLDELHTNINLALNQQAENFFTNPGGTFFDAANIMRHYPQDTHPQRWLSEVPSVLKHINSEHPQIAKQILKKYPDLF